MYHNVLCGLQWRDGSDNGNSRKTAVSTEVHFEYLHFAIFGQFVIF